MTAKVKVGDTVRFTDGMLGLMENVNSFYFEAEVVREGDVGVYVGPHPNQRLGGDWALVEVDVEGRKLLCPCNVGSFDVVSHKNREGLLNASKPDNHENSFVL